MPIVFNPSTKYAEEVRKWEQHHSRYSITPEGTSEPGNPYVFREYPKMVYRVQVRNGRGMCLEPPPSPYDFDRADAYERAVLAHEAFNRSCYRIVANESEELVAKGQGYFKSANEALEVYETEQKAIADAAAETAYQAQRMSTRARAELEEADKSNFQHVTDVTNVPESQRNAKTGIRPTVADPSLD